MISDVINNQPFAASQPELLQQQNESIENFEQEEKLRVESIPFSHDNLEPSSSELNVIDLQKQRSNAATRPNVGVGLIVLNEDDEVLVGRRKGREADGKYQFPGGWLEFGESFEECAVCELWEEAGILASPKDV